MTFRTTLNIIYLILSQVPIIFKCYTITTVQSTETKFKKLISSQDSINQTSYQKKSIAQRYKE